MAHNSVALCLTQMNPAGLVSPHGMYHGGCRQ